MNNSSRSTLSQMDFRPLDVVDRILHYWWVLVIVMLLGGATGYGISLTIPPQYEAQSVISVAIDYTRTGFLTDIEEDQTVEIVGDVIFSDEVIRNTVSRLDNVREQDFRDAIKLERKNNQWLLKVLSTDSTQAAVYSIKWVETAFEELKKVQEHALKAESYQRYLDSLASCLEETAVIEPAQTICNLTGLKQLSLELEETGKLVDKEKLASRGIMPSVSCMISQKAMEPTQPVRNNRGLIMLSSALAGLLAAILVFWLFPSQIDRIGKPEA